MWSFKNILKFKKLRFKIFHLGEKKKLGRAILINSPNISSVLILEMVLILNQRIKLLPAAWDWAPDLGDALVLLLGLEISVIHIALLGLLQSRQIEVLELILEIGAQNNGEGFILRKIG